MTPLAVKLRPSKHAFLFGCRITGADSVSEALEGLCDGALRAKWQIVINRPYVFKYFNIL